MDRAVPLSQKSMPLGLRLDWGFGVKLLEEKFLNQIVVSIFFYNLCPPKIQSYDSTMAFKIDQAEEPALVSGRI